MAQDQDIKIKIETDEDKLGMLSMEHQVQDISNQSPWSRVPKAKKLLAKESPHYIAKLAFNLKDHRKSHPLDILMNRNDNSQQYIEGVPDLTFKDNIELEDFLSNSANSQAKYNIDLN